MQQPENNRNFILAIVLSMLVLIGWQYLYAGPKLREEQKRREQIEAAQPQAGTTGQDATAPAPGQASTPEAVKPRAEALAQAPRVAVDTPELLGSISLKGARIDDLTLKGYHETTDKSSPNVVLFSPTGTSAPYYAEYGWASSASGLSLPRSDTIWTAEGKTLTPAQPLTLTWDNGAGLIFKRTIAVDSEYMFTVRDEVKNNTTSPVTLSPFGLVSRHGEPHVDGFYVLHEGFIGVLTDRKLQEYTYAHIRDDGEICGTTCKGEAFTSTGGWLGITDKYWATALIPNQERAIHTKFTRYESPAVSYQADYTMDAVTIAPGASESVESRLFAGAKRVQTIDSYETSLGIYNFNKLIDWGWFHFLTRPLFFVIDWLYKLIGNFGLAILAVTVLVKALFFPLANKSYAAMSKMKLLQPEMQKIQERFKDDRMKQQQAIMELYKKEKVSPLSGCLPVVVQIPVFFALYKVLFVTLEMRHAPFFGWIKDLSAPDPTNIFTLFGLFPWNPPHLLMLGIWPLIMGVTMWLQMKLNPPPPDPVQARIFAWMPVIFTFMLGSFPAGLVIYWAWNNTLSILQQSFIMSRYGVKLHLFDNLKKDLGWLFNRGAKK